ncbi:SDR family NAD(P)-dependent oxidoreductase [Paraburkholderia caballeronis]|uniref:NAD(P)-dependent dehydrogenase, short-chain alcohol dehydrogenase family n=1 Tax=Paraburkholderia caballeronis TaxID=416943 RepID=A0A1H7K646_9BURK|nr:SDR family NAD(P)-dependent oxidoreductase [Paraburkholderia caballeronis]PXW27106.1 NAD(P)-dependent dehydrogenase (short-subunit alcohol dehydrogenase family) [Paraburkholderia caballeronis]PXX02580.1 NAD(P)-dependent dehydrogenase (short-subunit alcohol dehydrogenase family) [Paraburkholderia caballeronis]RAK03305.1 NAD(P)-dependent dehydrogenase (short-subunit alcohol dehydrogenase family) [Paraburkholderia caballeronis]SEC48790.1 NAD(P)-dependent dehydrogenase, short-chain alcohol dehyd
MQTVSSRKTALLVGASRGLGLAMAEEFLKRGWQVIATCRATSMDNLRRVLTSFPDALEIETVDITLADQVAGLRARLQHRRLDLLFVNAGVKNDDNETIADVSTDEFVRVMVTNALSPMRVVEAFEALVPETGTIGVMSSGQGSVANNTNGNYEVYRGSKAALNMFMRSFAARHADDPRTLLLTAPGWVRTDMGGPHARLGIDESIPALVNTIEAHAGRPGLHYVDYLGRVVPW